ncbi:hypothetical protein HK405_004249 [Cladochytrium tenue]|nr:hypothetical protein HK405_004249 [Cladochytrium tenue]
MSNFPDFAWNDWGRTQPDRVLDLIDINFLRLARMGIDPTFKTLVWNLSQNVDRMQAWLKPGICPCLTPSMIPFITNRGGPLVGLEALSMQGIPVDELLLTRETQDQLADLAGNAMTTTVVGTSMVAALVLAVDAVVKRWNKALTGTNPSGALHILPHNAEVVSRVIGAEKLPEHGLDLSASVSHHLSEVILKAKKSSRQCMCEGRSSVSKKPTHNCIDCGHTSCEACGGRPEHNYNLLVVNDRIPPMEFEEYFKKALPTTVLLNGFESSTLSEVLEANNIEFDMKTRWLETVSAAVEGREFKFSGMKRQESWTLTFSAPSSRLVLDLDPLCPRWSLFVDPPKLAEPALIQALADPVARLVLDLTRTTANGLMAGTWHVFAPKRRHEKLTFAGVGALVESWESRLDLQGKFVKMMVWQKWAVSCPNSDDEDLKTLEGTYTLVNRCGAAGESLHRREETAPGDRPLFFFFDPLRCGVPENDFYVFAHNPRRLEYRESRGALAALSCKWRPSASTEAEDVDCTIPGVWLAARGVSLVAAHSSETGWARVRAICPDSYEQILREHDFRYACDAAIPLLQAVVPINSDDSTWPVGRWSEIDLIKQGRKTFEKLTWFTCRLQLPSWIQKWVNIEGTLNGVRPEEGRVTPCQRCAPAEPDVIWVPTGKGGKGGVMAIEDTSQASVYEQTLKSRPVVFVCQMQREQDNGVFRIGVNFASLLHRALSRLPERHDGSRAVLSYRVLCESAGGGGGLTDYDFPKFRLTSNRNDTSCPQPPHFKSYPLRPEQLRSLAWMIRREREANSEPFIEEEISEAACEPMGWRAEGRASRAVVVPGGVVADEVGYGKTAITLGLLDVTKDDAKRAALSADVRGRISVKATLVLAPGHLLNQWPDEVKKFLGSSLAMIVVKDLVALKRLSIAELEKADVVVVASTIFQSAKYWGNLESFAGTGRMPPDAKKGGRFFVTRYKQALAGISEQVERLKAGKIGDVVQAIEAGFSSSSDTDADTAKPTKRLKGRQYREAIERDGEAGEDSSEESEVVSKTARTKKARLGSSQLPDPWELRSSSVRNNWKQMKCILFEMIHWNRLVVDEFTYLKERIHAAIVHVSASNRWILSGTPPVKDFQDIKSIAVLLNVHLGVDDEANFHSNEAKKRRKEATRVEQFHAFREIHTRAWHAHRHRLAQSFLDLFLRQNIAEIDEILSEERVVEITLPPAERAIYMELEHHLQSLDMNSKRAIKSKKDGDGDREKRMIRALGNSSSAEEALLKRCSHFDLELDAQPTESKKNTKKRGRKKAEESSDDEEDDEEDGDDETGHDRSTAEPIRKSTETVSLRDKMRLSALQTCDAIVDARRSQLDDCLTDLKIQAAHTHDLRMKVRARKDFKEHQSKLTASEAAEDFEKWEKIVRGPNGIGDRDATNLLIDVIDSVVAKHDEKENHPRGKPSSIPAKKRLAKSNASDPSGSDDERSSKNLPELLWDIREETHVLRRLHKELVGRVRSLRFFEVVRNLLKQAERVEIIRRATYDCPGQTCRGTRTRPLDPDNVAVLSCCGHYGCAPCLIEASANQRCLEPGCGINVHEKAVFRVSKLGDVRDTHKSPLVAGLGKAASPDAAQRALYPGAGLVYQRATNVSGEFGAKLTALVDILREVVGRGERALVFVQFEELMVKVGEALEAVGLAHLKIRGTAHQKSQALQTFQRGGGGGGGSDVPVLLLNVAEESAAGANLTVANHVVFVGPLLGATNEWTAACETQAIGRARRYGQTRKVVVWRLVAADSIDSQLMAKRARFLESHAA